MESESHSFVKLRTEYYSVAVSKNLKGLLDRYRATDPILSTFDDRKLILYIVNLAIESDIKIATDKLDLSNERNIKLKKTKKIEFYFDGINKKYKDHGVNISARQYFHRLILGFLNEILENK